MRELLQGVVTAQLVKLSLSYYLMHLILLEAVSKPIHRHQLIGRRKVSLNHTSAACRLHGGGVVSFVVVAGGVPPVSVASQLYFIQQQAEGE